MNPRMKRLQVLERQRRTQGRPYAYLTDEELTARIFRLAAGREPMAAELTEWGALGADELKSRLKDMGVLDGNA